jgi:type I restriction enzyme, S subunit
MSSNAPIPSSYPIRPIKWGAGFLSGYAFKSQDFCDQGIPVVKIKNIQSGIASIYGSQCIAPTLITEKLKKFVLRDGDVLIAMTGQGSVGRVGKLRCRKNETPVMNQRVGKFIAHENLLNMDYLYYVISSSLFERHFFSLGAGSGQPNLSPEDILSVGIPFPQVHEQHAIASILRCLDDRISLLRETNSTLEAIAQALFKSWFVDFDPVRAKMEGRAPEGMDEATAALFPDSFEETELGEVPSGWMVQPIGELIDAVGGATPDTKNAAFWEPATHHWTSPKDLSGLTSPILLDTERRVSPAGLAKISSGSLPVGTLLMSSRAPIGYLAISQVPVAINQGYIAVPPGGVLPPLFMLFWCQQNMDNIKGRANGSTFMEISKKAFRPIPTVVPKSDVIAAFMSIASTLFARLVENERQAKTLSALRDTLLPRLISGQLRLPEAKELVDA